MSSAPGPEGGAPSPADIARRQFGTARKGYDPAEVRAYLTELAAAVGALQSTADAERERAEQARAHAQQVEDLDEGVMVELLGKETVRVLEAARSAAADIRRKAEEAASRLISEANDEAHRVRSEAEAAVAAQRVEVRAEAEAIRREANQELARRQAEGEELVEGMRRDAQAECDALRGRAQEEGRQMVTEAQVVRERMLRDLARRRRGAREQLERLNAARDRLLAAYEVVRRTVDTATGELAVALPEAKAAGQQAMRRVHDEPEPSVQELDNLVAMARIAGMLDPRLEESVLDEPEPDADGDVDLDVDTGSGAGAPVASGAVEDVTPRGSAVERMSRTSPADAATEPRDDVVDVVAVEATVVDAADAVDALRELVNDDDLIEGDVTVDAPFDIEAEDMSGDVDGRLFRFGEPEMADDVEYEGEAEGYDEPEVGDEPEPEDDEQVEDEQDEYDEAEPPDEQDEYEGEPDVYDEPELADEADADRWDADEAQVDESATEAVPDRGAHRSVDELFAQLRAGRQRDVEDPHHDDPTDGVDTAAEVVAGNGHGPETDRHDEPDVPEPAVVAEGERGHGDDEHDEHDHHDRADQDGLLLEQRDETLAAIDQTLSRRLKRVLADEQNEVLDLLRRVRKLADVDLAAELPDRDAHLARYVEAAGDDLGQAATAGAVQVAHVAGFEGDCDGLAMALGEAIATPLHERVVRTFEESSGDVEELTGRLRSLYREWKAQRIGDAVRHYAMAAYAEGAYTALPEGTPLRWLVDPSSDACPDADDNALAGDVVKGEAFPTGDGYPPAHPGCRCLVAPAEQVIRSPRRRTGRARVET